MTKKIKLIISAVAALIIVIGLSFMFIGGGNIARTGDVAIIDFAGYMDGTRFEGGTAYSFPLRLGSGMFIPGFEEQVKGMRIGEVRDVILSFPDDYFATQLAGREVIFRVTLHNIRR